MGYEKLEEFARQLLGSSAIKNLSPPDKEESVIVFINQNEEKLKLTFSSPEYFPNTPWPTLKNELLKIVGEKITTMILPQLEDIIFNHIDLSWKAQYNDFMISDDEFRKQLFALSSKLASRFTSRMHFGKMLWFMQNNVLQPFIMAVYENKRYIQNGLSRYDLVKYSDTKEALGMLYTGLLFMPLFDIKLPVKVVMPQYAGAPGKSIGFQETENNGVIRESFLVKLREIINKEFMGASPYFVKIISKTMYQSEDMEDVPYLSKVLKIVYNFSMQWKKTKRERGAESFEASWLNVARINYKFYSYDLGTLDEFYKITIEEDL